MVVIELTEARLRDTCNIEFDAETEQRTSKVYIDQIDKLTEKLLDYKRRLRNFEKSGLNQANKDEESSEVVDELKYI
jgi:hypothetical protein